MEAGPRAMPDDPTTRGDMQHDRIDRLDPLTSTGEEFAMAVQHPPARTTARRALLLTPAVGGGFPAGATVAIYAARTDPSSGPASAPQLLNTLAAGPSGALPPFTQPLPADCD